MPIVGKAESLIAHLRRPGVKHETIEEFTRTSENGSLAPPAPQAASRFRTVARKTEPEGASHLAGWSMISVHAFGRNPIGRTGASVRSD